MEIEQLQPSLSGLGPVEIAFIDAVTSPSPGVRKVTQGEKILLLSNLDSFQYADMVRSRLKELGKDPDNFVLGELPWGVRVASTPLILHKEKYYLQTITLKKGDVKYYIGDTDTELDASAFERKAFTGQGLPPAEQVYVRAYKLENIRKMVIQGVTIGG